MKNASRRGVLTPTIELWNFGRPGGLPSPHFGSVSVILTLFQKWGCDKPTYFLVCVGSCEWLTHLSFILVPILELQHAPLPPKCCEPRNVPQIPCPSIVCTFGFVIESIHEFGGASNLLFGLWKFIFIIDLLVIHPSPHLKAPTHPFYP